MIRSSVAAIPSNGVRELPGKLINGKQTVGFEQVEDDAGTTFIHTYWTEAAPWRRVPNSYESGYKNGGRLLLVFLLLSLLLTPVPGRTHLGTQVYVVFRSEIVRFAL